MRARRISIPSKGTIKKMNESRARDLLKLLTGLSTPEAQTACGHLRDRLIQLEGQEMGSRRKNDRRWAPGDAS